MESSLKKGFPIHRIWSDATSHGGEHEGKNSLLWPAVGQDLFSVGVVGNIRRLLDAALEKKKQYRDVQVLLQAVYDQGKE